jgi:uncharacterized protein
MNSLGIVLKLTERCNINCSYCYYFNGLDKSFKSRPARISKDTIASVGNFLKQGVKDLNLKQIKIGFHGGEPLLIKKPTFEWICEFLTDLLCPYVTVKFNLQTNGMLIDEEWIDLFTKYNLDLGLSIDGPQDYHDEFRVDHFGKGTYARTFEKVKLLQEKKYPFGILSVMDPSRDAKKIYLHFTQELGANSFDFLFPDSTHRNPPKFPPQLYGKFISDVFDIWTKDDNPDIKVRFLKSAMQLFLGGDSLIYGIGAERQKTLPLISIRSDGDLSPTDELMSTDPQTVSYTGYNVSNTSLKDFLQHKIFQEIQEATTVMPLKCQDCCWEKVCGGGGITNRFSIEKRFDNPSVYCDGLQIIYTNILKYLVDSGIPLEQLKNQLLI